MKQKIFVLLSVVFLTLSASFSYGQKAKPAKRIIFAVLSDGKTLEPIAYINKGKLEPPANGSDEESIVSAFDRTYYRPGTVYKLIFGGVNAGTVTAKSSNPKSECGKNVGDATTHSTKAVLKGFVMGLATNAVVSSKNAGVRHKPTPAEKTEIEALVRAEYLKQKLTPKVLHYQNLTSLDVDHDGKPEFVGSYWIEIDKGTRGLLFFIADKGANGKISFGYHEYKSVDQAGLMGGAEIKMIDEGVYNEVLLDAFDYDANGTAEIFTYVQSFEGAGFNAYKRTGSKWTRVFEGSNYHCAF